MFYINDRFGARKVLSDYLGEKDIIIPGEIQHGYWHTDKWLRHRPTNSILLKTFLWGGAFAQTINPLNLRKYSLIGDPFLYLSDFRRPSKKRAADVKWNLYPEYKQSRSSSEALDSHKQFVLNAKNFGLETGMVSFHPNESVSNEVFRLYAANDFGFLSRNYVSDKNFLSHKHREYSDAGGIFTNYLGAHLFRASILGIPAVLDHEFSLDTVSLPFREIAKAFFATNNGSVSEDRQYQVSIRELGMENLRERDVLSNLLLASLGPQIALRGVYFSKEVPIRIGNLLKKPPRAISTRIDQSPQECPHCYSLKPTYRVRDLIFCARCCARLS
jgi:hypothetical protein